MEVSIALAGNPNCGKTTVFNALTGSNQFVGNWPGVTVEKKEGKLKGRKDVRIVDLPGIYSLSPYTPEEIAARNYLITEKPDAVINIVDGTNIERNLYLSSQILELGIPVVLAINMMDIVEKNKEQILTDLLGRRLGCEAVAISALRGEGVEQVAKKAVALAREKDFRPSACKFGKEAEQAICAAEEKLGSFVPAESRRFFAIKLLEGDENIISQIKEAPDVSSEIADLEEALDDDVQSILANERYEYVASVVAECCVKRKERGLTVSDKIDRVVTNRILALPIFAIVMFAVYYISVSTVGDWATSWANDGVFGDGWSLFGITIPGIPVLAEQALHAAGCAKWLKSLVIDGIIGGVGSVLGFVPQMLVLFLFLAFLEACGYMARIAFIMDRAFRKFGLSGKSFIPMLIGTGCGVPGILASRTIESDRDRRMTVMTTTFIPCGAKLPIIALIAGAFFDNSGWISFSAFFTGIAAVICSGILLKKTRLFAGDPAPFVMELPPYRMPTAGNVLRSMRERGWSFIKKAGTIILLSAIVLWFLQGFGWTDGRFAMLEAKQLDRSVLAAIGKIIAPVFSPLGWGDWRMAVAAVTGLIAKENVVTTFGILFGYAQVSEDGVEIWANLASVLSMAAAYSFLIFNLLCAPCFAAMGAIRREMNDRKQFWIAIGYQTALAYFVSFCVYQVGTWALTGAFGIGTIVAVFLIAVFLFLLFRPYEEGGVFRAGYHMTAKAGQNGRQ